MDVMMPQTSGFEAMQKIRQEPGTRHIPAIIFSGKAGMKDFFEDISGVEFIPKTYEPQELLNKINLVLGEAGESLVK